VVKSNVNLNYFSYRLHMCQMRSRKSERSHMFQQHYLSSLSATSLVIIIEHTYFISEYEIFLYEAYEQIRMQDLLNISHQFIA
jgi:hypothetical protein